MKRIFRFKEGQITDGDEEMLHWLNEKVWENVNEAGFGVVKRKTKVIIEIVRD